MRIARLVIVPLLLVFCLCGFGSTLAQPGSAKSTREVAKAVSTPPYSNSSITILSSYYLAGDYYLEWYYCNAGDYDENGEVGIADMTPVALNFKQQGPFDFKDSFAAVDGDFNDEINSADIVQIARYYTAACYGYRVYGADNIAGPYAQIGEVNLSEGFFNPGERRKFTFILPEPLFGYYYVAPYDSQGTEGIASNYVALSLVDNDPPVYQGGIDGVKSATSGPGSAEVTVEWYEATDAQSPPVTYLIYYAESGSFDWATANVESADAPALSIVIGGLTIGNTYTFGVRAKDTFDNIDTNTNTVNAMPAS